MAIKDDDLLYVQRPTGDNAGSYKIEAGDLLESPVDISSTAPSPAREGDLWWSDTDTDDGGGRLYVYTGSEWVDTSLPGGALDLDTADTRYLSRLSDDTAAGEITFEGLTTHEAGVSVTGSNVRSAAAVNSKFIAAGSVPGTNGIGGGYLSDLTSLNDTEKVNGYNCRILPDLGSGDIVGYQQFQIASDIDGYDGNMFAFYANGNTTINSKNRLAAGRRLAGFTSNYGIVRKNAAGNGDEPLVDADGKPNVYNFYSGGDAPNYFKGLTEHEGGVKVTGGDANTVETGMYKSDSNLNIVHNSAPVVQLYDNGTAKCWTFGAPQDANIGFNVKSTPNVFSPEGAATQTGASFKTYIKDNAKSVTNITSLPAFGTSSSIENLALYAGNLSTVVPASGTAFKNQYVYSAGSASNTDKFSAANNYGFYSSIYNSNVGKNNYNFYAEGTAPSYFAGGVQFDTADGTPALESYERGTWSPLVTDSSNTLRYNTTEYVQSLYERIGNLVYVSCRIKINSLTTPCATSSQFIVKNLPFGVGEERFLSAVTCEFLNGSLTTPVEAGLVQAAQVALMVRNASGHVRGLVATTNDRQNNLNIVQISGIYKIA